MGDSMTNIIRKWKIVGIIIALLICLGCIAYAMVLTVQPQKDQNSPSITYIMENSLRTVVEKRDAEGSVLEFRVSGDPVFRDAYPVEDIQELPADLYDTSRWLYRVTYYMNEEDNVEFYFGAAWFLLEGKVYTMPYMNELVASIGGMCAYRTDIANTMNQ